MTKWGYSIGIAKLNTTACGDQSQWDPWCNAAFDLAEKADKEIHFLKRALRHYAAGPNGDVASEALAVSAEPKDVLAEECAWLIELNGSRPTWWSLTIPGEDGAGWIADVNLALRFARKQDAVAYIDDMGWTEAFASEHVWADGAELKECDCCGEMKPDVTTSFISYAGDTSACEQCRDAP
jgi:hypothetical protein